MSLSQQIKSLSRHSAVYTISTLMQRAQGLVLLPILTDTSYIATKSEYGDYTLVYTFIAFMNVFYLYGIDAAFLRYFFLGKYDRRDTYRSSIQLLTVTALITSALIYIFAEPLSALIFNEKGYEFFVRISAAILFIDTLCNLPYLILRAEERSVLFTALRSFRFVLELSLVVSFVVGMKQGVKGILYANLLAALINLIVLLPFQFKYLRGSFSWNTIKDLLIFGLPMIPNGLAYLTVEISDRYLMPRLLDKEILGVYGANYRFGTLMLLLVSAFRTAWQPFFLKVASTDNAKEIYARVMSYFIFGASFVVITGSMLIEYFVRIPVAPGKTLMGQEYWGGVNIIPVILLSYLLYGIYVNLTVGIYIQKKTRLMVIFTGLAALTNILSNLYLMPHFGMMGAAVATLLAYIVMVLSTYFANQKIYPISYDYRRIAWVFIYVVLVFIFFYSMTLSWYFRTLIIISMPVIFYLFGFFTKEEKIYIERFIKAQRKD